MFIPRLWVMEAFRGLPWLFSIVHNKEGFADLNHITRVNTSLRDLFIIDECTIRTVVVNQMETFPGRYDLSVSSGYSFII